MQFPLFVDLIGTISKITLKMILSPNKKKKKKNHDEINFLNCDQVPHKQGTHE